MKTIAVFFGGRSPEHDVSIITGQLVISGLKKLGHQVVPVYITKEGIWHSDECLGSLLFFKRENISEEIKKLQRVVLDFDVLSKNLILMTKTIWGKKKIDIDIAFPAFHGLNGEDGTIQGLFELANIPYVGCGVASSALTMDKVLTKLFFKSINISTVDFLSFFNYEWLKNKENILKNVEEKLNWPLIVKPAKLGSSIGISRAENKKDLISAIEVALHYDNKILVENFIENSMDLTCAVLGRKNNNRISLVQESLFQDKLFSYEDKYLNDGGTQTGEAIDNIIIPAKISKESTDKIQNLSQEIYTKLNCEGIARVDFLYDKKEEKVYAIEINTMPGTLYHHLWQKSGIELDELLTILLDNAESRQKEKDSLSHVFNSKILNQITSTKLK
ncbi:MAG: D-alanine--D-alanine ligase family protein [Patescibacteria group bacterium]